MNLWGLRSPHTDYFGNRGENLKGSKRRDMTERYVDDQLGTHRADRTEMLPTHL